MTELNDEITSFVDNVNQFSSNQFLKLISILKKFELFNTDLQEEEEHKENMTEYDFLWK